MKRIAYSTCIQKMKTLTIAFVSLAAAGLMSLGGRAQAQPVIANLNPSGQYQFQMSSTLGFTVTSPLGITNVTVQLTAQPLAGGSAVLSYLTSAGGLGISGVSTAENVTAPLTSNQLYSVVIQAQDVNGALTTLSATFDTIVPVYTWEAEDYDYSNGVTSGLYIDNPQTNLYANLGANLGVDCQHTFASNDGHAYRPNPPGLATEPASDKPRVQYNGVQDFDVGNNNGGDWGNYTRHYPAGTYLVFLRGSNGGGSNPQNDAASLTVVNGGTAALSGSGPYQFSIPNGGWQNWHWVPLIDSGSGNPAQITFDGSANTLRVSIDGGNCNENFYMLVPTNINPSVSSSVVITNIYPDGIYQFEQTNALTFTANSTVGINTNSILVQLTATSLSGQSSTAIYTVANGLSVTGTADSWNVSCPTLTTDMTYSAFIQVADVNGGITSTTVSFDTVNPDYYTFEAEDWNYGSGQYIDNPQTNGYYGLNGNSGIDFNCGDYQGGGGYSRGTGLSLEPTGDRKRAPYVAGSLNVDYDVDNVAGGDWGNYTRTFPPGKYNIYIRASNGNGPASPDSASLSLVTSDPTQGSQTTTKIGTFTVPTTGGWGGSGNQWTWAPLLNSGGNLAQVTLGGVETLRATTDGGSYNVNYYMLVPVSGTVVTPPYISDVYPDGTALFQSTNALTFTANSAIGIADSGVTVVLNGVNVSSSLTFSGSSSTLNVSCPLKTNTLNVAVITLTDGYGSTTATDKFDTFSPATFTFEAEDYDYTVNGNAGQFIDNPQVDQYNGLGSTEDVDEHDGTNGGNPYRPSGTVNGVAVPGLEIESPANDLPRAQYTAGGFTDYRVGFNNGGNWANYTRTYPAGTYNVYIRSANPNSPTNAPGIANDVASLYLVTGGFGTTSQTTTKLGSFNAPYTGGWGDGQTFAWGPLVNAGGNLAQVVLTGTTNTLRIAVDNGNYNVNFYALVPADTSTPVISNFSPSGASIFQNSNALSFAVTSTAGIATNSITVTLNGAILTNLVFSGSSTNWTVTDSSLPANNLYTAVLTVTSLNGETISATNTFDTINAANYQWEAEDYDYNGGQFFDNPQVDAYTNLGSISGIDNNQTDFNTSRPFDYRTNSTANPAPGTTPAGDQTRAQFASGAIDYSIGFFGGGGSWVNYTRHYPAGTYNVIGRFAAGGGTSSPQLSQVTAGYGTTNQTTALLGTFTVPSNGWSTWEWATLLDNSGNPAKVTLDGSQITLQFEGRTSEVNANFFILTPTSPAPVVLTANASGANLNLTFFTQTGYNYQIQYKNNLTDASWIDLGSPIAGINTNIVVPESFTGTSRFYRVHP